MRAVCTLSVILAACAANSADPGDDDASPDATTIESTVVEVSCAGAAIVATVETDGASYSPDQLTIAAGEVVRFDLGLGHDARSDDFFFHVPSGGEACLRFDEPGEFGYFCTPHRFRGNVSVE